MDKKGEVDLQEVIGVILFIVIFLPVMLTVLSMIRTNQCSDYQKQIDSLNNQISQLNAQLQESNSVAEFWKEQYENLTNTEITKKDFIEIKSDIGLLLNQINNTRNQVYNINQQIINIKHIRNIYFAFSLVLSLSFTLFGFALVDFSFFKLAITKKIVEKIYYFRNKIEINIHNKK